MHGMFPPEFIPNQMEQYILPAMLKDVPHFEDDRVIAVTAVSRSTGERIDISGHPKAGRNVGVEETGRSMDTLGGGAVP